MFTGLVQTTAQVVNITKISNGLQLTIESNYTDLTLGESIAVDGACLTVTNIHANQFDVEVSTETLTKTIINYYETNHTVNLERALQLGDRLGGHFVTGHIDQVATIKNINKIDDFIKIIIQDLNHTNYLIDKGSITVNGVSLTLNQVAQSECELMLIPHTLASTNLKALQSGGKVNIEFDLLAKIVAKQTPHEIKGEQYVN